jgi:hypothetical protein
MGKPKDWSLRRRRPIGRDKFRAICAVALAIDLLILATLLAGWRV